jgi:hypothetical protein
MVMPRKKATEIIVETPRRRARRYGRYALRRLRRMRAKKHHVGLFDLIGVGVGLGMSAFGPQGSDWQYFTQDPASQGKYVANGIVSGITGYDMINHKWAVGNLEPFWIPVISFAVADWLLKKLGLGHVRVYKNIKLA